ncbi:hypothetical protein CTKA_01370 [Chthonomonas calidirosea]|uniref:Uncharacterized protein n=1 Tax=Chthonomonas calidirosea (strain DSM 23976 / ICMP 18418 / T49) TaxID=1303518 RepID=S0EXT8_CHTCT|nr:hypothetical protein [Chthonomonas calidirosea]CCW36509.1 hypothetical protein CCALI_02720 [Chthonomonas calidirosea T49]CEK17126.1 hypothetical protein CTKA_01370 [Chthonomonas calidirosea]
MRSIKWFVGAAIGALLLAPGFAKANGIQYLFVSGSFQPTSTGFASPSSELVKLTDLSANPISPGAGPNYTLTVSGSGPHGIQGDLKDSANNLMFHFSNGTMSIFQTFQNIATFAVSGIKYSSIDPSIQSYIPQNSSGTFTGTTTSWNGTMGAFSGQFSASTPELGSSVAMATMLVGAGFLGFRKRR